MGKIKILHIVYAKEWGGGETCAYMMCKVHKKNGYDVFVIIDKNANYFKRKFAEVATVICMDLKKNHFIIGGFKLSQIVSSLHINVVHTHTGKMIPMVVLAKKFSPKLKIIAFRHNLLENKKDIVHKFLYKNVDRFVCVSQAVYNLQIKSVGHTLKNKFSLVYNGIDTSSYPEIIKRPLDRAPLILGYAGRIDKSKGLEILLEAMGILCAENADVFLRIAGEYNNQYGHFLQTLIKEKNLHTKILFQGFQEDMADFYQSIDIFILPSIIKEAFGLVLCEAMFFEKPVITTNTGAQPEIVDDGKTGYIVNAESSGAIVKAVQKFIRNPSLLERFGQAGKEKVMNLFTMDCWMQNMQRVYNITLAKKAGK